MKAKHKSCFGCSHLTSQWLGDGTIYYGCSLTPGLVTGESSALDEDDEPQACEKYTIK